jgi:hypothetical protein
VQGGRKIHRQMRPVVRSLCKDDTEGADAFPKGLWTLARRTGEKVLCGGPACCARYGLKRTSTCHALGTGCKGCPMSGSLDICGYV